MLPKLQGTRVVFPGASPYREDRSYDGVDHQGRHVVRRHLLSERRQGAAVVGLLVVHVEPPEDSRSPWRARTRFKGARRRRRTPAVLMRLPSPGRLPMEPMITSTVRIHTSTLEM